MPLYQTALPDGWTQDDVAAVAAAQGVVFQGVSNKAGTVSLICFDEQPANVVASWQAACAGSPPSTPQRTRAALEDQLASAMAAMQQIIDTPDIAAGTLTTAQLSNAVRQLQTAVKAEARLLRRILRVMRADYTGAD